MHKRDFLKHSAALLGTAAAVPLRTSELAVRKPIVLAICDDRYAPARQFGSRLATSGTRVSASAQNVIASWAREAHAFQTPGAWRIAGMTRHSDFELLKQCAASVRLRSVFECIHDAREPGVLTHVVRARGDDTDIGERLKAARQDWPATLAETLRSAEFAGRWSSRRRIRIQAASASERPGTLISFVFGQRAEV
ncbi:MAG TPA: hypothetical protein VLW26_01880 [Steroidobacteraceae bacterium]|nr:hypothetical protein [Steroidobacteraceae bacterium]